MAEMRTSGFLLKYEEVSKPHQLFYILDNFNLFYYDEEPAPNTPLELTARGTIDLSECTLLKETSNSRIEHSFTLVTKSTRGQIKLAARSALEYNQWIETLDYVINLAREKQKQNGLNSRTSLFPRLKIKVNGLIPLEGDVQAHAVLVATSSSDFSFVSPVLSSLPNNNSSTTNVSVSLLFTSTELSVPIQFASPGPLQLRVVQVSSSSSPLPRVIRSKLGGQSKSNLDLSFCVRGRVVAENDIDYELCASVAEAGKTVVVSIVDNIASAHPPPPPFLSPDGAAIVNKTRMFLGDVRSDLKMSEEQVQEVRKSTAERKELLENVEKNWFPQSIHPVVSLDPPSVSYPMIKTPAAVGAAFVSPPRAVLARAATGRVEEEITGEKYKVNEPIVETRVFPLSSRYDDNFEVAMNAVSEIIARRSATPRLIPTAMTPQTRFTSQTPQRQKEVASSSSPFLQAPPPHPPPPSSSSSSYLPQRTSTRKVISPSAEKSPSAPLQKFSPQKVPTLSSVTTSTPIYSLTDEEKIRHLISTSLRQAVKRDPVRLKIDSSRPLMKRLFSRFGEGGTTRLVPLFRFQDLSLRIFQRSVPQDQVNAVFKFAKSLEHGDEILSLEESLDFTVFVNALFILSILPLTDQDFDPLVKFSHFVEEKLTALARRLKIQKRKHPGKLNSSGNSSFVTDDALSFTQENMSMISESSPPRKSHQEIDSGPAKELDNTSSQILTSNDIDSALTPPRISSSLLEAAEVFSSNSPLKDLSPLPQALFNLLKESPPSFRSSARGERSVSQVVVGETPPPPSASSMITTTEAAMSTLKRTVEGDVDDDIKRLSARIQALDMDFSFPGGKSAKKQEKGVSRQVGEGPLELEDLIQKEELQQYSLKKINTSSPAPIFSPLTSSAKGNAIGTLASSSTLRPIDLSEVRAIFAADQNSIAVIFKHYSDLRVNRLPPLSGKKKSNAGSSATPALTDRTILLLNDVLRFAHDFDIIPSMMSSAQFAIVFSSIAVSSASRGNDHGKTNEGVAQTLRMSDFSELLAKVAMKCFNESGPRFSPRQAALHFLRSLDESKGRSIISSQDAGVTLFRLGRKGR